LSQSRWFPVLKIGITRHCLSISGKLPDSKLRLKICESGMQFHCRCIWSFWFWYSIDVTARFKFKLLNNLSTWARVVFPICMSGCMLPNENMAICHIRRPPLSHPAYCIAHLHVHRSYTIQYPLHVGSNPYVWFRTVHILCIKYSLGGHI